MWVDIYCIPSQYFTLTRVTQRKPSLHQAVDHLSCFPVQRHWFKVIRKQSALYSPWRCELWLNKISQRATNKTFHEKKQASRLKLWSCLSSAVEEKNTKTKYNISRRLLSAGRFPLAGRLHIVLFSFVFHPTDEPSQVCIPRYCATKVWISAMVPTQLFRVSLFMNVLQQGCAEGSRTWPHTCSAAHPPETPAEPGVIYAKGWIR